MSYRATLDVPIATVRTVSGRLTAHRRTHATRPRQRATTTWVQAVLVLRWLKGGTDVRALARDSRVSQATAYRYLHEALEVIARRAPNDITDVLDRLRRRGEPFACLDGTLVRTDRVAVRTQAGNHLWYSGKHKAFGGNVQVLTDHTGFPVWTAPVEPGSTHFHHRRPHPRPAGAVPGGLTGAAHAGGQGLHRGRHRHQGPGQEPRPGPRHQTAQRADHLHASPGRESQRPDQTPQGPTTRHPQPSPPSPPQPWSPPPSIKASGEKTSMSRKCKTSAWTVFLMT